LGAAAGSTPFRQYPGPTSLPASVTIIIIPHSHGFNDSASHRTPRTSSSSARLSMPPSRYTGAAQSSSTVSSAYPRSGPVSKTRRPSSIKSVGSGGSKLADGEVADQVEIEDFRPPEWRTVLNRRADLGERSLMPGNWDVEPVNSDERRLPRLLPITSWLWTSRGHPHRGEGQEWILSQSFRRRRGECQDL
jgi:hypothetical protein